MTVQQLIELLENADPTAEVVLSTDAEGNGFAPLESVSEGFFDKKYAEFTEDGSALSGNEDEDEDDEEAIGGVPSICLWPSY